jgi:hypothetical protein
LVSTTIEHFTQFLLELNEDVQKRLKFGYFCFCNRRVILHVVCIINILLVII